MTERNWKALGNTDWLEAKRAKALRVSNDREALQLKRIRRSLDSMKVMNENLLKQEERKVKRWLKKQAQVSPTGSYQSYYFKSSSYPESSQDLTADTQPLSRKASIDMPWSQFGDHLPSFVSFLRLPTKRPSCDRKSSKDLTPFSGIDLPMQTLSSRSIFPRSSVATMPPSNKDSWKANVSTQPSLNNSISLQEAMALFPSLQRLSTRGDKLSLPTAHRPKPISGLPSLQRKIKNMIEKEREAEKYKQFEPLPQIKPEEILSCRYLRLSQSNIDTLLDLCKESGIDIDLHPHMKESDIDVSKVLSSSTSRAL